MTSSLLHAGLLDRALMPGDVSRAHAKLEDDCGNCHVSFKREGQAALCLGCHKEVAADLKARIGFHGRDPSALKNANNCVQCHTEHNGRAGSIVAFDTHAFDHKATDFPLLGKHLLGANGCGGCHNPGAKYRATASTCAACHARPPSTKTAASQTDPHAGRLGQNCAQCHDARGWQHISTNFDHGKTGFVLKAKHASTPCGDCHLQSAAKVRIETSCVNCHKKDDAHKGAMGSDCVSCHVDSDWRSARFDHSKTGFVLAGAHQNAECRACHQTPGKYQIASKACNACHSVDDAHKGSLGVNCESCHDSTRWQSAPRFNHSLTKFPLTGGHTLGVHAGAESASVSCRSCHSDARQFRNVSMECVSCHRFDDSHKGRNGEQCADCHANAGRVAVDWKATFFEHDRTEFALRGAHRTAKCESCHTKPIKEFKPAHECVSCHAKDDPHKTTLGKACSNCHQEQDWKLTTFSHDRSHFVLIGAHREAKCADCHKTSLFSDTQSSCVSCHRDDDPHQNRYGSDCATCHSARDWQLWDFNHATTAFVLTGAHAKASCSSCHQSNAKVITGASCATCHAKDDPHEGGFGQQCARCHSTDSFQAVLTQYQRKTP